MPHNLSIFSFQFSPFLARRRRRATKGGYNIKKRPTCIGRSDFFQVFWIMPEPLRFRAGGRRRWNDLYAYGS